MMLLTFNEADRLGPPASRQANDLPAPVSYLIEQSVCHLTQLSALSEIKLVITFSAVVRCR